MNKERLRQYGAIKKELDSIRQQLEEVGAEIYSPRQTQITGMPGGRSGASEQLETLIVKQDKLIHLYRNQLEKLTDDRVEIETALSELPPNERVILRCHYIQGHNWEEVCMIVGYSWRQVHRIHSSALQRLREKEKNKKN